MRESSLEGTLQRVNYELNAPVAQLTSARFSRANAIFVMATSTRVVSHVCATESAGIGSLIIVSDDWKQ